MYRTWCARRCASIYAPSGPVDGPAAPVFGNIEKSE
jgi:hypothetical protein